MRSGKVEGGESNYLIAILALFSLRAWDACAAWLDAIGEPFSSTTEAHDAHAGVIANTAL